MSVKDLPDNYPWLPNDARYPMGDMGEAAVRMWSPVVFDRRGSVAWMDDFSRGLSGWVSGSSGLGSGVKIVTDYAFRGGYDALLTCGTTAAKTAYLAKYFVHSDQEKIGLEVGLAFLTVFDYAILSLSRTSNLIETIGRIKLDYTNAVVQYEDSAENYQTICSFNPLISDLGAFSIFKFVVDFSTGAYTRLMHNDVVYDLSDYDMFSDDVVNLDQFVMDLTVWGSALGNRKVQVSHAIITAGEN